MGYIKCPRCDLNWILEEQKLCDVCRAELKMDGTSLLSDEFDDEELVLCPVCKQNYMGATEEMCEQCLAEKADKVDRDNNNDENEESWLKEYIDEPDADDGLSGDWDENGVSLEQMEDEEFDDEDESYDDVNNPDDDLDFETYDDEEFDDEEDELEDEDEEEDDL